MAVHFETRALWPERIRRLAAISLIGLSVMWTALAEPASPPDQLLKHQRSTKRASGDRAPIRIGVNLVLVPVTVTDRKGTSILGLERTSFSIFEDGAQQPIASLSSEDTPCSIGVVFDTSGSMKSRISGSHTAIRAFLNATHPEDEVFFVTFSDHPVLQVSFTAHSGAIPYRFLFLKVGGATALVDSVYFALQEIRSASRSRRALLVVSDGRDNKSRYTKRELIEAALEADVQIYTIALSDYPRNKEDFLEDRSGLALLASLSAVTGGLHSVARSLGDLNEIASRMGRALHSQYVVGYYASPSSGDGKWKKIRVNVTPGEDKLRFRVFARRGYFSPHR